MDQVKGAVRNTRLGGGKRAPMARATTLLNFRTLLVDLVTGAMLRFAFVTFGGLVTLQSSEGFDAPKAVYLVGCAVALGIAGIRTYQFRSLILSSHLLRPLFIMAGAWIALVGFSFFVALQSGTAIMNWIRDAVPYVLIAAVPFMATDVFIDSRRRPNSPLLQWMFVVYGIVSTLGFTSEWLGRRGYANLPFDDYMFSTFLFPCAALSYAVAKAIWGERRYGWWAAFAALIFFLVIITGTRTGLVMLAAPVVIVASHGRDIVRRMPRILGLMATGAVIGIVLFTVAAQLFGLNTNAVVGRLSALNQITGRTGLGDSFTERTLQTNLTLDAFRDSPLLGTGPGHIYQYVNPYGQEFHVFVLDSPLSLAAKFGILGMVVFLLTLGILFLVSRRLNASGSDLHLAGDALAGFLAIVVLLSFLGSPFEDKGASFALAFLLALGFQRALVYREGDA